ncbi:hypothetical protein BC834DRAFT_495137 [Gloeopeniophorella convolvens]|nr:hypothetical protein BC834DRAFT_495137 [Gloeopeniophorella convolvens]
MTRTSDGFAGSEMEPRPGTATVGVRRARWRGVRWRIGGWCRWWMRLGLWVGEVFCGRPEGSPSAGEDLCVDARVRSYSTEVPLTQSMIMSLASRRHVYQRGLDTRVSLVISSCRRPSKNQGCAIPPRRREMCCSVVEANVLLYVRSCLCYPG